MAMLGRMYTFGNGVPIDYGVAAMWFDNAAKSGDPQVEMEAARYRDELTTLLQEVEANMLNNGFVDLATDFSNALS